VLCMAFSPGWARQHTELAGMHPESIRQTPG
jgi:hypothetical protein